MENKEIKQRRKRQAHTDRIVLDNESLEIVKRIADQVSEAFSGILKLTSKDIANFLLVKRSCPLSNLELNEIKNTFFNDLQAAQWAVDKLKEAKSAGLDLKLSDVLKKIQTPLVKEKSRSGELSKKSFKKSLDALPESTVSLAKSIDSKSTAS